MNKCTRYFNGHYCNALITKGEFACTEHKLRDRMVFTNDHAPASEGFPAFSSLDAWVIANNHKLIECVRRNNLWTKYREVIDMGLPFAETWSLFMA